MKKGFTILELLVAMSITLLLAGGVVAAFNNFNENQRVQQAVITLKSDLRLAQNKAVSGNKPTSGCGTLGGYIVSFAATSYTIQAVCDGSATGDIVTVTLPAGTAFSPTPASITFTVLTGRVGSSRTLTISGLYKSYSLTVASDGTASTAGF